MYPDDDSLIIISKKIMPARSISKINGETVTSARLREITGLLIDIHGQHEHQSLLYHARHLEILDEYGKNRTAGLKQKIEKEYHAYIELRKKLESLNLNQEQRLREMDFCRFEIDEIENADLKPGEEEECQSVYRRFSNAKRITESLALAHEAVSTDEISRALRAVDDAMQYDEELMSIRDQLYDVDSLLSDLTREISAHLEEMTFDGDSFNQVEERLDLIRNLESKYGKTIEDVLKSLEEKKKKLEELENYDLLRLHTEKELKASEDRLEELSAALSKLRQEIAGELSDKIEDGLKELNFLDVKFAMEFRRLSHFTPAGYDEAEFMISTNPGEPVRPLGMVASGGELSRIMLAVKTVLAETDDIPTLIFDEIDTGISGRTAQMVSEKLRVIARSHQVICITHLPQIAAMADSHFEIRKSVEEGRTTTTIRPLDREQMTEELARLLGGAEITETVRQNAREMKELADGKKGLAVR
ncbi:hypothetical protein HMPREF9474_01969 [ [[Clostridium] symbiosum WAL-14163]|uniref:DNA repair protein RecN n=1 Tax=Clostridium symbiosum (strain WAL-14163) TaxID=742740 RepID=E7GM24_CLOS6|nr:DNA repair protein RecN [[Clostridium] symbiosum]EGA94200.1 hypothetical protein HMPREF9474_01969 [ [[Clostridium] symbiosum WAL-14163]